MIAAGKGHAAVITPLLEAGADIESKDKVSVGGWLVMCGAWMMCVCGLRRRGKRRRGESVFGCFGQKHSTA